MKEIDICHSLTISSTSISSIYLYLLHPECYSPQYSGVTLHLHHPHPHSIPEHKMVAAPEIGSEFFPQPGLGYYL
jgi:hypothetical protein